MISNYVYRGHAIRIAAGIIGLAILLSVGAVAEALTVYESDGSAGAQAPPSSLHVGINNGATYTNSTFVALSVSAVGAEEMSFSNDSISWSAWEPFAITKLWTLTSGDGQKTVYFKARNSGGGEAIPGNASIILDTTPPS